MKILHIADLHLGKKCGGYSLMEDQRYFLNQTVELCKKENISDILIAGDIYDVSSPSGAVMEMWSDFLSLLVKNRIKAYIIPGNHDSRERVGYMDKLAASSGIYVMSEVCMSLTPFLCGDVRIYLLPYTTASFINEAFGTDFKSYQDAIGYVVSKMNVDKTKCNILVAHQLVLPSSGDELSMGGSEEPVIGTVQNVNASLFSDFDYVALGHIHKGQKVARNAYYSGSPICYHKDEAKIMRHYNILDVNGKDIKLTQKEIVPLRRTCVIRDDFENILTRYLEHKDDYVYAEITSDDVDNAMSKLKTQFPYALGLTYIRKEALGADISQRIEDIEKKDPRELFSEFYKAQTGLELTDYQKKVTDDFFKEVASDED